MTHTTYNLSFLFRIISLAGSLALASALPAQTPDWFPLEVGNTWLYRQAVSSRPRTFNPEPRSISVHGKETVGGKEYFKVTYFEREVLLRTEPSDGSVVAYDPTSGAEQPWLSLGLPVGATFPTTINSCTASGTIEARDASVPTPAGTFTNAVQVKYQGPCADAGYTRQYYAANIGLVSSEETTFAGPLKFDLVYYRVGFGTGGAPEVSFTVAADAPRYAVDSTMQVRLTLRSTGKDPIHLHFPSGQSFDLRIMDENRTIGYLWSTTRIFTAIIRDEDFGPGEKTFGLFAPLNGLPPGRYTAEGFLTTSSPLMYSGMVSFEIVPSLPPDAVVKPEI